jgi:hypothetical protein
MRHVVAGHAKKAGIKHKMNANVLITARAKGDPSTHGMAK